MRKLVPTLQIEQRIHVIRGHRIMLDSDLAVIYGVTTKRLNEQVKRNLVRFPGRYMFQLSETETARLRSQIATSKIARGGRRYRPFAFTEHGAIMLASVLNSPTAIQASIAVVDAFMRLREFAATHKALARKIAQIESKYDSQFKTVFDAIRELIEKPADEPPKVKGFRPE